MSKLHATNRSVSLPTTLALCSVCHLASSCLGDGDFARHGALGPAAGAEGVIGVSSGGPELTVVPVDALDDAPLTLVLSGFEPDTRITLRAEMSDAQEQLFASSADFLASSGGRVDLSLDAPATGGYDGVDAMGLLWSMRPVDATAPDSVLFDDSPLAPRRLTFTATVGGRELAWAEVWRRSALGESAVVRSELTASGLVGAFFVPATAGSHPTLLVLGGSEGGRPESRAALLASHGYAALALEYFGGPGLPAQLASVPLEYFEQAFAWLEAQTSVDMSRFGIMGSSKGGELALLLASRYPELVHAVVAYVPSSVVWQGIPKGAAPVGSSWSYQGDDLPYVPMSFTSVEISYFLRGEPQALTPAYLRALEDSAAVEMASIAAEQITAPVLLVSAGDDAIWPSRLMAEAILARRAKAGAGDLDLHFAYDGAGHLISHPYLPTSLLRYGLNEFGGTPAATAAASAESWREVRAYLAARLE